MQNDDPIPTKITLAEAVARVNAEPVPFALLFERGDLAIELYIPHGTKPQLTAHDQDEVYLVLSGAATLERKGEQISCGEGDVLYIPAHTQHRFINCSADFRTWVVYLGGGGAQAP